MLKKRPQRAFVTIQWLSAVGLSLIVFVMLTNVIFIVYTRGVLKAAVDEASRSGSRATTTASSAITACNNKVHELADNFRDPNPSQVQLMGWGGEACEINPAGGGFSVMRATVRYCPDLWLSMPSTGWCQNITAYSKLEYIEAP